MSNQLKSTCFTPEGRVESYWIADIAGKATRRARLKWREPVQKQLPALKLAVGMALLGKIPEGFGFEELLEKEFQLSQDNSHRRAPKPIKIDPARAQVAPGVDADAALTLATVLDAEAQREWERGREEVRQARRKAKFASRQGQVLANLEKSARAKHERLQREYIRATGSAMVTRNAVAIKNACEMGLRLADLERFIKGIEKSRAYWLTEFRRNRNEGWGEHPPEWLEEPTEKVESAA